MISYYCDVRIFFGNGCLKLGYVRYICNFCCVLWLLLSTSLLGLDLIQNSSRKNCILQLTKSAVSATNYCFIVSLSYSYFCVLYNILRAVINVCCIFVSFYTNCTAP